MPMFQPSVPGDGTTDLTYQRTRQAMAQVRAGTRRMRIGIIGDSRSAGVGSTESDGLWGNMQPNNWPTRLAALLTARGYTARDSAITGWRGVAPARTTSDPRITFGTGWNNTGSGSLGGSTYYFPNGGGTASLVFDPGFDTDHVRVWYVAGSGNGSVQVLYDATSLGTINTSGGGTLGRQDYSYTAGRRTISLTPQNQQLNICAVEVWHSAAPHICVLNFAVAGALVSSYLNNPNAWAPFSMITGVCAVEPIDLWIVCLDTNDSNNKTALATYESGLTSLIAKCLAGGTAGASDVLMIGSPHCRGYETQRPDYIAAAKRVAAAAGVRYLSLAEKWGNAQRNVDFGLLSSDIVHENKAGYQLWAEDVLTPLLAL